MRKIKFTSQITVKPVQQMGGDHMIVAAAKVSTSGEEALAFAKIEQSEGNAGLINYLMKHRHGCYDDQTEVLTENGWKKWPDVVDGEKLATISSENRIEFQKPKRIISKEFDGPMIRIKMELVNLLVTPDHNMLASCRKLNGWKPYSLYPASEFLSRSHRIRTGGGEWSGEDSKHSEPQMKLLGFFIGNGTLSLNASNPSFRLRRKRKVDYLKSICESAGYEVSSDNDRYYVKVDRDFLGLLEECYNDEREKVIPRSVLSLKRQLLECVFDGLINSNGSVSKSGRQIYTTTSQPLAGQIQELTVKIGRASVIRVIPYNPKNSSFGKKTMYSLSILRERKMSPRIGWTKQDREKQVTVEHYTGMVYCATVENGTLYVRRNGKPCWCGNSPFEHSAMTFFIHAPVFVWWEWVRHRIGFSYNLESSRYKVLDPVFWIPRRNRKMVPDKGHKPARPKFTEAGGFQHWLVTATSKLSSCVSYLSYQAMIKLGIASEVARSVLPFSIYFSGWVTCNPRSLMSFLSLRTHDKEATFVSYPQAEIEEAARIAEAIFSEGWPLTYKSFNENGRVGP